ncbi:hypothetical protein OIE66_19730 [Nonomuraea sp. NBC_01738]|nr:hypothetical protein OIE66_19730 [Nonomuraea sp. NBC_01738]
MLAERGEKVRGLTRRPESAGFPAGVEACSAPDFAGVEAVVVNLAGAPGAVGPLLRAARAAGVRRAVTISALVVAEEAAAPRGRRRRSTWSWRRRSRRRCRSGRTCGPGRSRRTRCSGRVRCVPVTWCAVRTARPGRRRCTSGTWRRWRWPRCWGTSWWGGRCR